MTSKPQTTVAQRLILAAMDTTPRTSYGIRARAGLPNTDAAASNTKAVLRSLVKAGLVHRSGDHWRLPR